MITSPKLLRPLYPGVIWNYSETEQVIYLTFDDGPHPEITPALLDILDEFAIKATFFCVGKNSEKHPHLIEAYKNRGHQIGHHTFDHLNGLNTSTEVYVQNAIKGNNINSKFFRPPYGKLKPRQLTLIKKQYKVVMWDVLSKDYKAGISVDKCLNNVLRNIKPGSVIVFHESEKAGKVMLRTVPLLIETLKKKGWSFGLIH